VTSPWSIGAAGLRQTLSNPHTVRLGPKQAIAVVAEFGATCYRSGRPPYAMQNTIKGALAP